MITIVDAIIILALLTGAVLGFKKGVIRSAAEFVGTILVLVGAYTLKNPIAKLMFTNLPFFKFSGALEGVTVLNILIYEVLAFLLVALILWGALRVVIALTGILETILKMTIVLGIPSKILGFIFGLAESFIIVFMALFCINQIALANNKTVPSILQDKILSSTPLLSNMVGEAYQSVDEIVSLAQKYEDVQDKNAYNKEALDILLKNKIITKDATQKLIDKGKLKIDGIEEVMNKY